MRDVTCYMSVVHTSADTGRSEITESSRRARRRGSPPAAPPRQQPCPRPALAYLGGVALDPLPGPALVRYPPTPIGSILRS